jgi:hypothetical protein
MKILIVAQARSGSTSLLKAISKSLNCKILYEPFNEHSIDRLSEDVDTIKYSNNIVVKVVDNHFYKHKEFEDEKNFFAFFDKVIGLTRNSTDENVISLLIARHFNSWRESSKNKNFPYSDEYIRNSKDYKFYVKESEKIKKEIKAFNIFQVTYEGIFLNQNEIKDLEEYLGFNISDKIEPEGNL